MYNIGDNKCRVLHICSMKKFAFDRHDRNPQTLYENTKTLNLRFDSIVNNSYKPGVLFVGHRQTV